MDLACHFARRMGMTLAVEVVSVAEWMDSFLYRCCKLADAFRLSPVMLIVDKECGPR